MTQVQQLLEEQYRSEWWEHVQLPDMRVIPALMAVARYDTRRTRNSASSDEDIATSASDLPFLPPRFIRIDDKKLDGESGSTTRSADKIANILNKPDKFAKAVRAAVVKVFGESGEACNYTPRSTIENYPIKIVAEIIKGELASYIAQHVDEKKKSKGLGAFVRKLSKKALAVNAEASKPHLIVSERCCLLHTCPEAQLKLELVRQIFFKDPSSPEATALSFM